MDKGLPVLTALCSRSFTGFFILGLGSPPAAYSLAAVYEAPMGPSTVRRLLEPVMPGTTMGAVFALHLVWLHPRLPVSPLPRIPVAGVTPVVLGLLWMYIRRPPDAFSLELVTTPLVSLSMFLLYGFLTDRLYGSWNRKRNQLVNVRPDMK